MKPVRMYSEKTPRLSEAVKNAIETRPFLKTPLELDLINYSSLARQIKPQLEKQLGQKISVESIAMALHRNVATKVYAGGKQKKSLLEVIADCKVHLLSDMIALHYPYSRKLQERLHNVKAKIENGGGNLYNIERANEISLITQKQFRDEVQKIADKTEPLEEYHDVALLSVQYPPKGLDQPGVFNYLVSSLTAADINLLGVFSSYSKISFVVSEKDAAEAYLKIAQSIETAKTL